ETLPRIGYSPVPTYTMSGFDSLTPIPPIVPPKYLSVTGSQVSPPSVVLNTPPPVVPIQYSLGRDAEPATATERPPRKMPISRHLRAANTVESYGVACADAGRGEERTATRATMAAANGRGRVDTAGPPGEWTREEPHVARKRRPAQGRRRRGRTKVPRTLLVGIHHYPRHLHRLFGDRRLRVHATSGEHQFFAVLRVRLDDPEGDVARHRGLATFQVLHVQRVDRARRHGHGLPTHRPGAGAAAGDRKRRVVLRHPLVHHAE